MKHFLIFLVIFIIACFTFPKLDFVQKTRMGDAKEEFQPLTAKVLPYILSNYISRNYVRFEIYQPPNHVKDLFRYNSDFSVVYKVKPKYTIILVEPVNNSIDNQGFNNFKSSLKSEFKYYQKDFNIIYRKENDPVDYSNPYDKSSAEALLSVCRNFCLIDPNRDTIFVFKRLSNTEADAIPVLLQEYHNLLK